MKIIREKQQKNRLHHYRSQIVALKAENERLRHDVTRAIENHNADLNEPLPSVMLEALAITEEAVAAQVESEALALLRELNDALAIPERFQPRVDAVLDRAAEK